MLIFTDFQQCLLVCFLEREDLKTDELVETHLQDRCRLTFSKMKLLRVRLKARHTKLDLLRISGHQAFLCVLHVL